MNYPPSTVAAFSTALGRLHAPGGAPGSALPALPRDGVTADDLGYLTDLLESHRLRLAESRPVPATIATPEAEAARFARLRAHGLTPRECEVLGWIAQGKRDAEIAAILGCAARTVGKHVEHLLAKLGAETRLAAAHSATALLGSNT
jgi:DNA-binding CsgD family transcriptional regulator